MTVGERRRLSRRAAAIAAALGGVAGGRVGLAGAALLVAAGRRGEVPPAWSALLGGVLLGAGLVALAARARVSRRAWLAGLSELLGFVALGALVRGLAPPPPGALTAPAVLVPLLAVGATAGLTLGQVARPLRRPSRAAVLVAALLAALACRGTGRDLVKLSERDRVALALGASATAALDPGAGGALAEALAAGRVKLRFEAPGPPAVLVVDVEDAGPEAAAPTRPGAAPPSRAARLLSVGGRVRGGVPLAGSRARALLAGPTVEGALPWLLAATPPKRARVVGLGTGVALRALLDAPGVEAVALDEPVAGVLAAHRDAGDLFAAASRRPLDDPRVALDAGQDGVDVLLAGDGEAEVRGAGLVVHRLEPPTDGAAWRLRERLAALGGDDLLVFWPSREAALLVVRGARLDVARVESRLATGGAVTDALGKLGVAHGADLVGLLVAGGRGVPAYLAEPAGEDDPVALARAAAATVPDALELPADAAARAETLRTLAAEAGGRGSPAALPLVKASVAALRTSRALRLQGDLLSQLGQELDARLAWQAALEVDPTDPGPRLSLALSQHRNGRPDQARLTLQAALSGDPLKDGPVRYIEGQLCMADEDYEGAEAAFLAAGSTSDAPARAALAKELAGKRSPVGHGLPPETRLAAAAELLRRAEAATDKLEAETRRTDAVATLVPLLDDLEALSRAQRAELGRLALRTASSDPLPGPRRLLAARAADALARAGGDPDSVTDGPVDVEVTIDRAQALIVAGEGAAGRALLERLVQGAGARSRSAWAGLGDVLVEARLPEGAMAAYEKALAVAVPSSADAQLHMALADLHRAARRHDRAASALEAALRVAPDHVLALLNLGATYLELKREGDALRCYKRWLEVAPPGDPRRPKIEALIVRIEGR